MMYPQQPGGQAYSMPMALPFDGHANYTPMPQAPGIPPASSPAAAPAPAPAARTSPTYQHQRAPVHKDGPKKDQKKKTSSIWNCCLSTVSDEKEPVKKEIITPPKPDIAQATDKTKQYPVYTPIEGMGSRKPFGNGLNTSSTPRQPIQQAPTDGGVVFPYVFPSPQGRQSMNESIVSPATPFSPLQTMYHPQSTEAGGPLVLGYLPDKPKPLNSKVDNGLMYTHPEGVSVSQHQMRLPPPSKGAALAGMGKDGRILVPVYMPFPAIDTGRQEVF